eukprot:TRINITY_DN849_c0_g1_i1.p1 TRINITY_DN849_c0_g1~~TRINITY_DN849_c0_g1_i1.p1  ORF type:complete len:536 (+),score=150.99 TRINITY_DN849_c0_g1_i1:64-1671(+)
MVRRVSWSDVSNYWVNEGIKALWIGLWLLANIAVFLEVFFYYWKTRTEVFEVLGFSGSFARGSAAAIKLNGALIMLTVLRNFLSIIRSSFLSAVIPVDKNIVFHKGMAWAIAFWAGIHMGAHYINYMKLSQLTDGITMARFNLRPPAPSTNALAFTSSAGSTGHILIIIMVFMYSSATAKVRSPMFEAFWFTHHLFIVFHLLLCLHGYPGVLEPPTYWAWVIGPLFLYIVERTLRIARGKQDTILLQAIQHPTRVMEVRMQKASFVFKPGQYLFLACDYIGKQEWHPFTITSCPDDDYVSVHIRAVGDWTNALAKFLNPDGKIGIVQEQIIHSPDGKPIFRIDGPFGAASEEVFKYRTIMMVGAGIGVTPFASILKDIRNRVMAQGAGSQVQKVYFYWIAQDKGAFEWFSDLLSGLENEPGTHNFLEFNIYLTGALSATEVREIMIADEGDSEAGPSSRDRVQSFHDQITGLRTRTNFGRPKWGDIFRQKTVEHPNENVGVFFCGPRALSKALYNNCRRYTAETSTKFKFKKENF